ncbi:MAG TPA: glutathione S-transferase family protein [Stellaceae bacterium]|nr:glutathione S-transferase family protein [Stellaceae bacterium]
MALTLYHNDMSVCAQKVRLALAEKGLVYEAKHLNLRAGDQQDPAYLKLNPKGVVPTLVHDGTVVTESIVINEYIDDAFAEPPLKPADPAGRARMRWWTKHIDDGIFAATGTVSMSIAFHHQYAPEVVEELARLRGPSYRQRFELLKKGADNPAFPDAIKRLDKMVADMNKALEHGPWLVGTQFTLADIAHAPYVTRLDHLKFLAMLDGRKYVADWYERMRGRASYRSALAAQFNAKYLPLMAEKGSEAWPKVKSILAGA